MVRRGKTRTQYLTAHIGAVVLKQDGHVTAIATVQERKDVTGPFKRNKEAFSAPANSEAAIIRQHPHHLIQIRILQHEIQVLTFTLHTSTHRAGSRGGHAGGLSPSVWFCRKSIIVRLTVCSSRSGPAGRHAIVTATLALQSTAPQSATAPGPREARHGHGQDALTAVNRPRCAHNRPHGDRRGNKRAPGANLTQSTETEAREASPSPWMERLCPGA